MFKQKDNLRVIKTTVSIVDYVELVNEIVDGYFDLLSGEYQPHLGIANCMQIFYNQFYKNKDEEDIVTVDLFEPVVQTESFMKSFNDALIPTESFAYDFAHAYIDAMDIVDTKKNSIERMISGLRSGIMDILNTITPILSQDNIDKLLELSSKVSSGEVTAEKILDTYKDSKYYKEFRKQMANDME